MSHIYVDTWRKFLKELGYEIVVRKKGESRGFVVTDDDFPSPLRFRNMNLDLESILGDKED